MPLARPNSTKQTFSSEGNFCGRASKRVHCRLDKLGRYIARDQALLAGPPEKFANSPSAGRAVVDRIFVYVHPDESVCPGFIQSARQRHGMFDPCFSMFEAVGNALLQN